MSLAAKLPFRHRYAAGFPGLGSQPVPTDADALDYLDRMAAADGASVEVGVATAVSAFVAALKADSLWDAIGSSCLLCGPRTLAGALVPLRGDAPTAQGGWASGDYDRATGLTGDGNALYLDSNRANDADPQDDNHNAAWIATGGYGVVMASSESLDGQNYIDIVSIPATRLWSRNKGTPNLAQVSGAAAAGLYGTSRSGAAGFDYRTPQGAGEKLSASDTTDSRNVFIYARSNDGLTVSAYSTAKIAYYSIGTSIDLSKLDSHISSYVTAIGAAV